VPCDLTYQDGSLLLCRWDRFAATRYPLKAKGAGFTAEEEVFARGSHQCRPTGITVDAAGRVFVTAHYLAGNVVSPHCPSDLVMIAPANPGSLADETKATADELRAVLSTKAGEARRRAHLELLRRGKPALAGSTAALAKCADADPAAAHWPWLAAASGEEGAADALFVLAADVTKPKLRLQSLRALAAFPALRPPAKLFAAALADLDPAVQLAGLEGLFTSREPLPVGAVAKLAAGHDPTLRQVAAKLFARSAKPDDIATLAESKDARTRLAAVLAAGTRLTVPAPDAGPPAGVKLHFPAKSAFFSPELRFADAAEPVDLTKLGPIGSYTTAQAWAARKATPDEERLFKLLAAALDDRDDLVRSQAAYYLGWLRDPRTESAVARVRLELRTRGLADRPAIPVKEAWRLGRFAEARAGASVERGPIDLGGAVGKVTWEKVAAGAKGLPLPDGKGTAYLYFRVRSRERQPAILGGAAEGRAWHNGSVVVPESDGSLLLDLQPGSNDILMRTTAPGPLAPGVRARGAVSVALPEKADGATLAERLKTAKGAAVPPEFLAIDWSKEGKTGDAERGRKLFGSLGCAKCHAITAEQAGGGAPSLADAGKRFTAAHLAESILLPDRLVADEFRATRIRTADAQTFLGLVIRESPEEVELLLSDATRRVVKVKDIEERKPVASSPMPAGLVKTPAELRDLLTYLTSDRPQPP
jgi:putative heme-binding domain-containing protein